MTKEQSTAEMRYRLAKYILQVLLDAELITIEEAIKTKAALLEKYKDSDLTLAFHSAPQDVDKDVKAMYEVFGDRPACAVREITKLHEEAQPFTLKEGLEGQKRGEYVLVVGGAEEKESPLNALSEKEHIQHYMAAGLDKKEALKKAAKDRGVSKSELYPFAIDL